MAELAAIKDRIRVISNLRKVTRAMELVTRTKINRIRQNAGAAREYFERSLELVAGLAGRRGAESRPPEGGEAERHYVVGFLSQKGFCGGFNEKVVKRMLGLMKEAGSGQAPEMIALGRRTAKWAFGGRAYRHLSAPEKSRAGDFESLLAEWSSILGAGGRLRISFVYNRFISILDQQPTDRTVFPFEAGAPAAGEAGQPLFDPGPEELYGDLVGLYLRAVLEKTYWENLAGEYCARLLAMKSANDNAALLIDTLRLQYNKTRQAKITQELAEIVSAFDSLKGGGRRRTIEAR